MPRILPAMLLIAATLAAFGAVPAQALWVPPDDRIPVARLISNLEQQLASTPEDPHLLARLGRIHSLAYALGLEQDVPVQGQGENPTYTLYEHGHGYPAARHVMKGPEIAARIGQLHTAMRFYRKAAKQAPEEPYIWLGLGYTYDEMAHAAAHLANPTEELGALAKASVAVRRAWEDEAVAAYARAMGDSPELESSFLTPPVALEAARYLRTILEARDKRTPAEKRLVKTALALAEEAARRPRMVTPILFPLDEYRPLAQLLAPDRTVTFDLDGTEQGQRWPWVKPDTALLVWDADGRGDVPSGRVLIGSVTWWLFWEDGYAVLRALDDDQDGWLAGSELIGLAAWQDANSNGVSDPGEVRTLAEIGVHRLCTTSTVRVDAMPANPAGLEMSDGRVLPTYDWITGPAAAP